MRRCGLALAGAGLLFLVAALPSVGADAWYLERGTASWYGQRFHGLETASGEIFDLNRLTAAHRELPFGARVKVIHRVTGASVGW
jgi:rare lipoprotein A